MLKVYDQYKNPVASIYNYTDLCIESELETGDKTLSFTYRGNSNDIKNEYYIETETDRFVVKEVNITSGGFPEYNCQLDLEGLEREVIDTFSAVDCTLQDAANLAVAGTGWRIDTDIEKVRSTATMNATPREILEKIRDAFMCEIRYDSKNEVVYFREEFGEDRGVFFEKSLNLKKVELKNDSYDYYTRILPIGADDLRIGDVNDGVDYLENYQYSDKIKTYLWEDTNYEDPEALKEDAEAKLEDMSKPTKSYSADVLDLAAVSQKYDIMDYSLGDTITLIDEETGIKDKQRIVKLTEYPLEPVKNSCELSNTFLTFEELQAKLDAAAAAFEDITNSDGTVNGYYVHGVTSDGVVVIETVIGEDGSTTTTTTTLTNALGSVGDELSLAYARIGTLEATTITATEADLRYATIENLEATQAYIEDFEAKYIEAQSIITEELAATTASVENLYVDFGSFYEIVTQDLEATNAIIENLYADNAYIKELVGDYAELVELVATDLTAQVANITSVLSGEIGTGLLETVHLTSDNAVIDSAVIVTALMDTVLADLLVANTIYTDYIKIADNEGHSLWIDGATMQFTDENGIVREQIGMDASGIYNNYIWDENGILIWNALGLTEDGLTGNGAIIRNKAVADDAAISGYKLDIDSVKSNLNESGYTISGAQVTINDETLDYALSSINEKITGLEGVEFEGMTGFTQYWCLWDSAEEAPPLYLFEDVVAAETDIAETDVSYTDVYDSYNAIWSTTQPEQEEDRYLWICFVCDYEDGHQEITPPLLITDAYVREITTTTQTRLKVVEGEIDELVSKTEITDQHLEDMWADINITLDEITSQVGDVETILNGDGEAVGLISQISTITQTINEISINVQDVRSDLDENYYTSATIDGIIEDQYTEITLSVEKELSDNYYNKTTIDEYVDDKISKISIQVTGGIGSTAGIILTKGTEEEVAELDLTEVRQAFANDDTDIIIYGGTIQFESNTFICNSDYFSVTAEGTVSATKGIIGGFTLDETALYTISDSFAVTPDNIYIGINGISLSTNFNVTPEGELYAILGFIGGWNIGTDYLYMGTATPTNTEDGCYLGTDGFTYCINNSLVPNKTLMNEYGIGTYGYSEVTAQNLMRACVLTSRSGLSIGYTDKDDFFNGSAGSMNYSRSGITINHQSLAIYTGYGTGNSYLTFVAVSYSDQTISIHGMVDITMNSASYDALTINGSVAISGATTTGDLTAYGDVVSNISEDSDNSARVRAVHEKYGTIQMSINNSSVMGLYDSTNSKWIIRRTKDQEIYVGNTSYEITLQNDTLIQGAIRTTSNSTGGAYRVTNTSGNACLGMYMTNSNNIRFGDASYQTILYGSSVVLSSGTAVTSDRSLKSDIQPLSKSHDSLIDHLIPRAYILDEYPGKTHIGLVVDEVEDAMKEVGLEPENYALTTYYTEEDGRKLGAIRYEEIIPILVYEIQQLKAQIQAIGG